MTVKLADVLNAVNGALSVLRTLADTPGVSLIPYVSTISSALGALQAAVNAGRNIAPYVLAISSTFSGTIPTQAELDALDAKILELDAQVDVPLPPKEEGEPD